MSTLENKSITHLLLQIIGPALIAVLVCSLTFFLIEMLYRGPHTNRLYWVLGLFTAASVLVSRISIEEGQERAALFGLALAAATLLTCLRLVHFAPGGSAIASPIVILTLIGIAMWTSAQLTWDCTIVDRSRDPSEMGLVEKLLNRRDPVTDGNRASKADRQHGSLATWLQPKSRRGSPGMTVLYFALVALPVFGLGQKFVAESAIHRTYLLFAMYLGSSLGLLLMTSLLGLERYLSRRNLHVPDAIVRNWLIVGGLFAVGVMLTVMIVPRPSGVLSLDHLIALFHSPAGSTSRLAQGQDGRPRPDKEGRPQIAEHGPPAAPQRQPGKAVGQPQENADPDSGRGSETSSGQSPDGPERTLNQGVAKQRPSMEQPESGAESGERPFRVKQQESDRQRNRRAEPQRKEVTRRPQAKGNKRGARNDGGDRNFRNQQAGQPSLSTNRTPPSLRWWLYLITGTTLVVVIWMFRHELAAWLRRDQGTADRSDSNDRTPPARPLPTFNSFRDPFTSQQVDGMTPCQLARYSMAALDALARDLNTGRREDQTPAEFARQWMVIDADLSEHAMRLADLYGRCAFSRDRVNQEDIQPVARLWRSMNATFQSERNKQGEDHTGQ